ncbi:MAG: glutathione peroxidase [Salinivirgaceae bacterium]|nr:glutathione peroxidase [Salinivirgaceae bacterium]MDD4747885.1 glutathione peroxidase [Salinivirgaceae bacterium]MDY0281257.1 glutathione peroxidase [Salinivirgaceae bacterium]
MKTKLSTLILGVGLSISVSGQNKTLYDFTVASLEGEEVELAQYKGKKVMVVNTASKCGFTGQYEGLEKLYQTYKDQNFVVLGFPANNFLKQEPGSNEEIREFCTKNYGVSFPMMAKISVKGDDIHPLYKWLTNKVENKVLDSDVSWNFQKFLIDENGNVVQSIPPRTDPESKEIIDWIEGKK